MKQLLWRVSTALAVLLVAAAVTVVLILRSQWFFDSVRNRIVDEAQRATGARVELGAFAFDWRTLQARVDGLVLHGSEPAGEPPLVRLESATLGLKLISALQRQVNLESLRVEQPRVHIIVFADGSTNIPGPRARPQRLWTDDLLNLKIGTYEIRNGVIDYDQRSLPLNVRGQDLNVRMTFDPAAPAYPGEFSSAGLRIALPGFDPIESSVRADFVLERDRVQFRALSWNSGTMVAEMRGTLEDLRQPHGTFTTRAEARMADLVRRFRIPVDPSGAALFDGDLQVVFTPEPDFRARGRLVAQGLRYTRDAVDITGISLQTSVDVSKSGAELRKLDVRALDAAITGSATIRDWSTLTVDGTVADLNLRRVAAWVTPRPVPWNGRLSGSFEMRGTLAQPAQTAHAVLAVTPEADGDPLEGHVEIGYDQGREEIAFGATSLNTPSTHLELEGVLGRSLRVRARSTRLEDLLPALALADANVEELPLRLNNGSVSVDGLVAGPLNDPHFRGLVSVVNGDTQVVSFDRFAADLDAKRLEVVARDINAVRGRTTVTGSLRATADANGDFGTARLAGDLTFRGLDLAEAGRLAGLTEPMAGTAAGTLRVSGTADRPQGSASVDITNLETAGEKADRLRANLAYFANVLEITDGLLTEGSVDVRFSGRYQHADSGWRSGQLSFSAAAQNLPLSRIERVASLEPKVAGIVGGQVRGAGQYSGEAFRLTSATADVTLRQILVDGQNIGDVSLQAETEGTRLTVAASGNVRESRVEATGSWSLEGDSPGGASVHFSRLSVDSLQDLVMLDREASAPTVVGYIEGNATVDVALQRPQDFRAEVRLSTVQVAPRQTPAPRLGLRPDDIIVRNSQPVVLDVTAQGATVRAARFTARDTQMDVTGSIPLSSTEGADLEVRGNIDLAILQLLEQDLQARGTAAVSAAIRGSLRDPNVSGQLSLSGAQLYLADLPNGVDNASGTILFDRQRATVQQLSAETGGGRITFTGFLEFGDTLVYRLQAQARNVRVRYPQDVSTSFDAALALNGTAQASTLSGRVTLNRAAFNITADVGQLLAQASQPAAAPGTDNEYLSGMQLDVRIVNGPNFQLETSLSSDVEADVDLRLRGTPARPALLGSIAVDRGDIQVFGNRYQVERGDIRFLNPVRIEPSFDMDLSTRARGVIVNISFSGTLQRMNVNYSSDPPLQSAEIIALLAVGRDPMAATSQIAPGIVSNSATSFAAAGGSLLGQAASAQVSNRLQRFFGASRVKIDPTLTGVDNIPQARLTLEQQVSKDITLTYITNLNRTQEQIVRVQWDLNREWSAIAVRDPSGLFGIDFQFRKRFK